MFKRILVATDFSETADAAWRLAADLARTHDADVVLLHAHSEMPVYSETAFLDLEHVYEEQRRWARASLEERAAAANTAGLRVTPLVRVGAAAEAIAGTAADERVDLVVVGTHGRGGLDRLLLGSVAERVVRQAPCPVLVVRTRAAAA
jgi:nucleotide-binding universal stress UspA family protein